MIVTERQADLDDLLASCRSDNAKLAFAEAAACFRAGAYRACIVSTWTAVVFDYVGKLRELELSGNGDAKAILESFENARRNHDVALSQKLEAQVLADAVSKFELLTPIEQEDLERLRMDRHRCAHPSLLTLDDPYRPTAELARCHMRNAAEHLLSRPPVQGREAWDRIWADIQSEFFPNVTNDAEERLRPRLSRARPSLIRGAVVELTKQLLRSDAATAHSRFFAALHAITRMHHAEVEKLLRDKLPSLAAQVPDSDLRLLLEYCASVELAWGTLGASAQGKLKAFTEKTAGTRTLALTAGVGALWQATVAKLPRMNDEDLADLAVETRRHECLDEVVRRFENSKRYKTFAALRKVLRESRLRADWTGGHRERLGIALHSNGSLLGYAGFEGTAVEVLSCGEPDARSEVDWKTIHDALVERGLLQSAEKVRSVFPSIPGPKVASKLEGATGDEEDADP